MSQDDSHTMQIRVPRRLWDRFRSTCTHHDATPSEVIREFMRAIVREEQEVSDALSQVEAHTRDEFTPLPDQPTTKSPTDHARSQHTRMTEDSRALWQPPPPKRE